jgi:hypothetical protein
MFHDSLSSLVTVQSDLSFQLSKSVKLWKVSFLSPAREASVVSLIDSASFRSVRATTSICVLEACSVNPVGLESIQEQLGQQLVAVEALVRDDDLVPFGPCVADVAIGRCHRLLELRVEIQRDRPPLLFDIANDFAPGRSREMITAFVQDRLRRSEQFTGGNVHLHGRPCRSGQHF